MNRYATFILGLALSAAHLSAQSTVTWDGGGDGVSWSDRLNWNTDAVPAATNDVVITVPASTVIVSRSNVTVRSVQCAGGLLITNSDFTVTAGASHVNGALTVAVGRTLTALNSNTTFTAQGAATLNGDLTASGGGVIEMSALGAHTDIGIGFQTRRWWAQGAGSVVRFPLLTNITPAAAGTMHLRATTGGRIEFPALTAFGAGYLYVYADGVNARVDMPQLVQAPRGSSDLEARNGATVATPLVTEWRDATLVVRHTNSFLPTAQITTLSNVSLTADQFSPDLTNVTASPLCSFYAFNGAQIVLPNVTAYTNPVPRFQNREFRATGVGSLVNLNAITNLANAPGGGTLFIRSYSGGDVLLGGVTHVEPSALHVWAEGAGSIIDLPHLANSPGGDSHFEARGGGTVHWPNVVLATNINLVLRGTNSTLPVHQITSLRDTALTIDGVNVTLTNVTAAPLASFYVENGGRLTLPNLREYTNQVPVFRTREFRATGAGSVLDLSALTNVANAPGAGVLYIRAFSGGQVWLPGLAQVAASSLYVWAEGGNSQVDLANLQNSPGANSHIEARAGGTLNFPNLVLATNLTLVLRGTNSAFQLSQVTSLANSSLTVDSVNLTLPGVTDVAYASLYVEGGGRLTLPNATVYPAGIPAFQSREFRSTGAGSVLDLSALTELNGALNNFSALHIRAYSGGDIWLTGITTLPPSYFNFFAENAGSTIDLSNLTTSPRASSTFEVRSGAVISVPQLTRAEEINIILRGAGTIPTAQIVSLSNSVVTVDGVAPDFSAVTNADLAGFTAENGGRITLPNVTAYGGVMPAFFSRTWQASGANSLVELTNIAEVRHGAPSFSALHVRSLHGGTVQLTALGKIRDSAVNLYSERTNSLLHAPMLTNWSGYGTVEATLGGTIQFTSNTLSLTNVSIVLRADGTNRGGTIALHTNAEITGTGVLLADVNNGGRVRPGTSPGSVTVSNYTQTTNGALVIEIGGTAPTNGFDVVNVLGTAALDGQLDVLRINNFTPPIGSAYRFVNASARSGEFARFTGLSAGASTEFVPSYDNAGALVTAQFTTGPTATNATPRGVITGSLSFIDVTFNEPIAPGNLWTNDAVLTGPNGFILLSGAFVHGGRTARFHFAQQTTPGTYTIIVGPNITDVSGNAMNQDGDALNGEATEDRFTNTVVLSIADLAVSDVVAPSVALPGQSIQVRYIVANVGAEPVSGARVDAILLSGDDVIGGDVLAGLAGFNQVLATGAVISVTQTVNVPLLGPAGNLRVVVQADYHGAIAESSEANNAALSAGPLAVPHTLQLQLVTNQVAETGSAISALVSRNGDVSAALVVDLSTDATELSVPSTATIPAGQNSAAFNLTPVHDSVADGDQTVAMNATAAGFASAARHVTVRDVDTPHLVLGATAVILTEGSTGAVVTVSRTLTTAEALTVSLASSAAGQLSVPATVVIPGGEESVSVNVRAVDDTLIELTKGYSVTASAAGHESSSFVFTVQDNDVPALTLSTSAGSIGEGGFATMTVTRSFVGVTAATIELLSSSAARMNVPSTVTIPAGQSSASFTASAVDNGALDGNATVSVTAYVRESQTTERLHPGASADLTITDNDGPALTLRIARDALGENASTTATVTRNTPATNELTVTLAASDANEATVPASVVIANGQASASFTVTTIDDGVSDGSKTVTLTASAGGFSDGVDTLLVTDINLPDLTITSLTVPTNGLTGENFNITFREMNLGTVNAAGTWSQVVWLSRDPYPGDDERLTEFTFSGDVPPGLFVERSTQLRAPLAPGDFWIIVTSDVSNRVAELVENNNTAVAAIPLRVDPSFTAVVQTSIGTALANTPVPMTGTATRALGGPAPFELVSIHILVKGTKRVISALTDAGGNFSATFTPLPGEGGSYTVGAGHPGLADTPVQDAFTLLGMSFSPPSLSTQVVALTTITGAVQLVNLADVPLSGLTATVLDADSALNISATVAGTLGASGITPLGFTIESLADAPLTDVFTIRVASAEGAVADLRVTNQVVQLRPRLVATPNALEAGMRRGGQTIVPFTIVNTGGAESGPLTVLLPNESFLHLSSPSVIDSIPAGGSNVVTLQLLAATNQPLGTYFGNIVVSGTNSSVSVPYNFRSLSDSVGGVQIEVVDEYTYYAAGAPRVAGADVTVRDAISRAVVTNGIADSNGLFAATPLVEGYYDIEVRATNHSTYRATILSPAGSTTNITAFLARQAVRYVWTVEPTEIEDRTRITVESVFETFVPIPVITVEPALIDLAEFTNEVTQIDLKIENHGLIAAESMAINFGTHPSWIFTPLIREVGTLNARSSITVPVMIRRVGGAPDLAKAARPKNGGGCGVGAAVVWSLQCGNANNGYSASIGIVNAGGGGCGGGFGSGGGGGPGGGFGHPIAVGSPAPCNPCDGDISLAVAKCLFSFFPLDCPGGIVVSAFDCISSGVQNGFSSTTAADCLKAGIGAGIGCADLVPAVGLIWNTLNCINDILQAACNAPPSAPDRAKQSVAAGSVNLSELELHRERVEAIAEALTYPFGNRLWLSTETNELETFRSWVVAFSNAYDIASAEGAVISAGERTTLLGMARPSHLTSDDVTAMLDRWNRSLGYYAAGIFYSTNVPFGESPDFIAMDVYHAKLQAAYAAAMVNEAEGFPNITDGLLAALEAVAGQLGSPKVVRARSSFQKLSRPKASGVCAQVRLRLEQEAVITRDAFRATLELINGSETPLENIRVNIAVKRSDGSEATTLFGIGEPALANLANIAGTGTVFPNTTGSATWTLIPTSEAAPADATVEYFVSGTLTYRQDGVDVTIPLAPSSITVFPNPSLRLKYFHERDVLSDDPFTEQIEPSQPYSLAVMVQNIGYGTARNMRIASSQPQIIENEKGLLIDFDIIATEVAGENLTPSLTVSFGDIEPGAVAIGRWLLKSTLQGQFVDYSATFEHVDGLGDPRLSLIESVEIHELIRTVRATNTLNDALPDFLVNDFADDRFLPDTLYLSDASTAPVTPVTSFVSAGTPSGSNLTITLQAALPAGWSYLRMPDPANGRFTLTRIVRSDGAELARENFWVSDRTFIAGGRRPLYETNLHLLDFHSTGNYTLFYAAPPEPDTTSPSSIVTPLPSESYPNIPLTWSGADETNGSGLATFDVFVSDNGGPFTLWLADTTLRGAIFVGAAGHTYAFYTRARDVAGNVEPAPSSADAQTTVALENMPPVIAVGGNQTVNEGATVTILNFASDADPGTALSFSLGGGSPSGATIHPGSGTVTWLTGEGNGPSTNTVIIVVTDNGVPPLSATGFVSVVVNEVNVAPAMAFITNRVVNEGAFVSVQPSVSDADVPANAFTWSLSGSVPEGAAVDAASGLFTWTPNSTQGPSTNTIQIVATDNGVPALSATQRFTIVVRNTEGDFKLSIGTTNVYAGASGTVPLTIQSSTDITNLTVGLEVPQARLTNLMLSSVAPELSSSVLVPNGTDRSELRFVTAAGQVLDSAQTLAWLAFGTVPNTNSAIVPLDLFAVLAVRSTGAVLTNGVAFDGRVFLVGNQPLLDAEPGSRLALYGHTGGTYTVEFSTNLPALTWSNAASVTLTGAVHRFTVEHTNYPALFFRARQE